MFDLSDYVRLNEGLFPNQFFAVVGVLITGTLIGVLTTFGIRRWQLRNYKKPVNLILLPLLFLVGSYGTCALWLWQGWPTGGLYTYNYYTSGVDEAIQEWLESDYHIKVSVEEAGSLKNPEMSQYLWYPANSHPETFVEGIGLVHITSSTDSDWKMTLLYVDRDGILLEIPKRH